MGKYFSGGDCDNAKKVDDLFPVVALRTQAELLNEPHV